MENEISLIVAYDKNKVIGNKGQIPWSLPQDQQRFKELTLGNVVVMGRRTFEEIFAKLGKPLPGRHTIVVSKTKDFADLGCETASSLAAALEIAASKFTGKPVFICGGGQLYQEGLTLADKLYITEVELAVEGDTYFPEFSDEEFKLESQEKIAGEIPFTFNIYRRNLQIDTLPSGLKIIQDKQRFMYGIDAVLLSAYAAPFIRKKDTVVDLGTGTGIIPLMLSSSNADKIIGVEVQPASAKMAKESIALNGLEGKIDIEEGDIKSIPEKKLIGKHSVEVVVSNPPYMVMEDCEACANDAKTIARHEVLCSLEDVVAAADFLLKPHGTFFMIHRPYRLADIFAALSQHGLEPKRMQLVHPFADKEPNMVLIEARKNAKSSLRVEAPLVVRESNGEYTEQIQNIYELFRKSTQ